MGSLEGALDGSALLADICFRDLVVDKEASSQLKAKPDADASLKFGSVTTDHMLQIVWNEEHGWRRPEIKPLQPISLHPCAQVLHYGTECFEGMKAYKDKDGKRIRLFRPDMHLERLRRSVSRIALPDFDKEELLKCMKELLKLERDWIPDKEGFSVYIRPTVIGTHASLGVQPPKEALLFVVLSPVGPYLPTGLQPVNLFIDTKNTRAFPGGVGDRKIGGNYGPTIKPQLTAAQRGCSQVLFVLSDGKYDQDGLVGEAVAMNIFFLMKSLAGTTELVTPSLDGTILPGVTRDTVLRLCASLKGLKVCERPIRFSEVEDAAADGRLLETFGTGTACMIQPISQFVKDDGKVIPVPFNIEAGQKWIRKVPGTLLMEEQELDSPDFNLCGMLMRVIMDIHYGHTSSEWSVLVD